MKQIHNEDLTIHFFIPKFIFVRNDFVGEKKIEIQGVEKEIKLYIHL